MGLLKMVTGSSKASRIEIGGKWIGGISGATLGHMLWNARVLSLHTLGPGGWMISIVGSALLGRYIGKKAGRAVNEAMYPESAKTVDTTATVEEIDSPASA